ncbi:MAG: DNA-binding protein [Proteobacteria bacterium]|nr:DNA-binding protein [Pseudomonadota bacterium]
MNRLPCKIKRTFVAGLPHGEDILSAVEKICNEEQIAAGIFSIIGAVRGAAFGYYEQDRKRYRTIIRDGAYEIISCLGNVSIKEEKLFVHAHVLFGDEDGACFGGHLMSPATIFAAELHLQELDGEPPVRRYDETTGLFLWG